MSWKINFSNNFNQTGEPCLQLENCVSNYKFRSWYGPFAAHLFNSIRCKLKKFKLDHGAISIDKHFAQHTLIQASFLHQKCLYEYQVNSDLSAAGLLDDNHDLAEILLFIRMTDKHPCQQSLEQFTAQQTPWCHDMQAAIDLLLECKLIQQVKYQQWLFFDKNPYPHNHLLDIKNNSLVDYNHQMTIDNNHKLLISSPI